MNLEKDVSPTGLYNYLPKARMTRRRRARGTRRMTGGYRTLEDVKYAVETYQGTKGKDEMDPVPARLVKAARAKGLGVKKGVTIGDFMNAFKAHFGANKKSS